MTNEKDIKTLQEFCADLEGNIKRLKEKRGGRAEDVKYIQTQIETQEAILERARTQMYLLELQNIIIGSNDPKV